VLVAPPGTGKTTLVPLALAAAFDADRAGAGCRTAPVGNPGGAARIAALLGEPVGETVGYTVRGDELIIGNVRAWVWAARKLGLGVIELLALSADTMIWRTSGRSANSSAIRCWARVMRAPRDRVRPGPRESRQPDATLLGDSSERVA
jgi:hypothetical protein